MASLRCSAAVEQPRQALGDRDLVGRDARAGGPRTAGQLVLDDRYPRRSRSAPACCNRRRHQAVGLIDQRQQEVLAVDLGVTEAHRLRLRIVQGLLRLLGQTAQFHCWPPVDDGARRAALEICDAIQQFGDETDRRVVECEALVEPSDPRRGGELVTVEGSARAFSCIGTWSAELVEPTLHLIGDGVQLVAGIDLLGACVDRQRGCVQRRRSCGRPPPGRGSTTLRDRDALLGAGVLVPCGDVAGSRWRRCRRSPRSGARRAAPAGCPRAGSDRARGCRRPSRVRLAASRCRPRTGCHPRC